MFKPNLEVQQYRKHVYRKIFHPPSFPFITPYPLRLLEFDKNSEPPIPSCIHLYHGVLYLHGCTKYSIVWEGLASFPYDTQLGKNRYVTDPSQDYLLSTVFMYLVYILWLIYYCLLHSASLSQRVSFFSRTIKPLQPFVLQYPCWKNPIITMFLVTAKKDAINFNSALLVLMLFMKYD